MANRADASIVLEVCGFSFRIGKKSILREVSFSVRRGEHLSIVGPNGAGKTTLLKCIDRILPGGEGQIEVFGRPLASYSQRELARRISYVPQGDGRLFPFTVEEFVLMGRYPYLSPFSSIDSAGRRAAERALDVTGTREFAARRLDSLSGGERQKVYIAAALAQEADVLLLDEPTTYLDYRHQAEIRDLLAHVNRVSGVTIVSVTHDLNRAALDSGRIVALCEGEVVFCGPPCEIMRPDVLERIFRTSFLLAEHPHAGLRVILPEPPREPVP
jgi:iron complex transport system ATP-binding protein